MLSGLMLSEVREAYTLWYMVEGPSQVISADLSTKEVIPKGMPEAAATLPVCPGNEFFSVLLS